ncbi:uncharacterized protein BXZ73DRAFT_76405 [Epithele typhae]|uniref:uncharacterized protein n=1 Tax=Epithele typhae TaxID=378194 RepID=UPI00200860AE|nr:uncharacterized protein BXZ73DRAFT_76405 [Epithele typhae]KAH9937753.1 hypothetical protein BXZ73DRAFT_76405 [Epithele typhae]
MNFRDRFRIWLQRLLSSLYEQNLLHIVFDNDDGKWTASKSVSPLDIDIRYGISTMVWDAGTGGPPVLEKWHDVHDDFPHGPEDHQSSLVFSPSGTLLIFPLEKHLHIYDLPHAEELPIGYSRPPRETAVVDIDDVILASAWSPDGAYILTLMRSGDVFMVDPENTKRIHFNRPSPMTEDRSVPYARLSVHISNGRRYALVDVLRNMASEYVEVWDLSSATYQPRFGGNVQGLPIRDTMMIFQAVLRHEEGCGSPTVLAVTTTGALLVDSGPEDELAGAPLEAYTRDLLAGFKTIALSEDGERALCVADAEPSATTWSCCVVETRTGGFLSDIVEGDFPVRIFLENGTHRDVGQEDAKYRRSWFWNTHNGCLYRLLPTLDTKHRTKETKAVQERARAAAGFRVLNTILAKSGQPREPLDRGIS